MRVSRIASATLLLCLATALSGVRASDEPTECDGVTARNDGELDSLSSCNIVNGDVNILGGVGCAYTDGLSSLSFVTQIKGSLHIDCDAVSDIFPLRGIEEIQGHVTFSRLNLTDNGQVIAALQGVTSVGGDITFENMPDAVKFAESTCAELTSLAGGVKFFGMPSISTIEGFGKLRNMEGGVEMTEMKALTQLTGFSQLNAMDGVLSITFSGLHDLAGFALLEQVSGLNLVKNAEMSSLLGLAALSTVADGMVISDNAILENLDYLNTISIISGDLLITNNPALKQIDGLQDLTKVGGFVSVQNNAILANVNGLANLVEVGLDLEIMNNGALTGIPLNSLTKVYGNMAITGNVRLTELSGKSNLVTLEGSLTIEKNNAISDISGFDKLESIGGHLAVTEEARMGFISGFNRLQSIRGGMEVRDNPFLKSITGMGSLREISTTEEAVEGREPIALLIANNKNFCDNGHVDWAAVTNGLVSFKDNSARCEGSSLNYPGKYGSGSNDATDVLTRDPLLTATVALAVLSFVLIIVVAVFAYKIHKATGYAKLQMGAANGATIQMENYRLDSDVASWGATTY